MVSHTTVPRFLNDFIVFFTFCLLPFFELQHYSTVSTYHSPFFLFSFILGIPSLLAMLYAIKYCTNMRMVYRHCIRILRC